MKSTPKSISETRTVTFECVDYDVECNITFGEPETRDYPGSGDEIEITAVNLDGEDVTDTMTIGELRQIEDIILGL
jgi:hypothetical protein